MKKVAVYLGANPGNSKEFCDLAYRFGRKLAEAHIALVYGGSTVGTMKSLADGALGAGGIVYGVFPKGFKGHKENHYATSEQLIRRDVTHLMLVKDMAERKKVMSELCTCCVALPGGWGTLDELLGHMVERTTGVNSKPVFILNHKGYYGSLKAQFLRMSSDGFIPGGDDALPIFCDTLEELLEKINALED